MLIYVDAITAASFHSQNLGPILQTLYLLVMAHFSWATPTSVYKMSKNPERQQFKGQRQRSSKDFGASPQKQSDCKEIPQTARHRQAQQYRLIEHGLMSAPTQYRLYGQRFFTGQKTQPTVSKY